MHYLIGCPHSSSYTPLTSLHPDPTHTLKHSLQIFSNTCMLLMLLLEHIYVELVGIQVENCLSTTVSTTECTSPIMVAG